MSFGVVKVRHYAFKDAFKIEFKSSRAEELPSPGGGVEVQPDLVASLSPLGALRSSLCHLSAVVTGQL